MKVFNELKDILKGDFDIDELKKAVTQMKKRKSSRIRLSPYRILENRESSANLLQFCHTAYHGNRPDEWGVLKLVPVPKN